MAGPEGPGLGVIRGGQQVGDGGSQARRAEPCGGQPEGWRRGGRRPPFWSRQRRGCRVEPGGAAALGAGGVRGDRDPELGLGCWKSPCHFFTLSSGTGRGRAHMAWPSFFRFLCLSEADLKQNKATPKHLSSCRAKRTISVKPILFFLVYFCYSETDFKMPWSETRLQMSDFSC